MWIFTTAGFVSAVEDKNDPDRVLVRSRDRESLETVTAGVEVTYGEPDLAEMILENAGTDYQYRVSISKADFAAYVAHEIQSYLTYGNFKNALVSSRGPIWGGAAMQVWTAMWGVSDDS